ncbi:MAG: hypothetical protein HKN76_14480, partial [Saprospiraceae bacterium]|nr:hypothetical protein [Saprospiraceae bacterium]
MILMVSFACSKDSEGAGNPVDIPGKPASRHPFLIVTKEEFAAHRAKATVEPWSSMKADAMKRSEAGAATKPYNLQDYIGAAALAYILDEDNAQVHAHRVRDAILEQYAKLEVVDGGAWSGVVPNLGSFYMAILALDIVYDALSEEEITKCEEVISSQIFKINREGSWADVRLGTHGTWDIYKGERTTPDDAYYEGIMRQITVDGVSPVTIHYAWERVGGGDSRLSKAGYMDVLEYTGIDKRYYGNERLQKFQRWLFGSSVNCSKEMAIIGDMLPTQNLHNDMLHRRVVNFDMEAAGYAAWFHDGVKAKGTILTYLLPQAPLPAPIEPSSQIYTDGGAFFRERETGPKGLHLVLYNIKTQDEWHTHQEVNGLAFSGYGNRLLVNGGRLGNPVRPAPLNNTLTIGGKSHGSRLGGGIVEGFTSRYFDYACGSSGRAIPLVQHRRSTMLIHSEQDVRPYVILFDEVQAAASDQIINYLHPANESSVNTLNSHVEYLAKIDHYPTIPGARLTFFYATPPTDVIIEKVASAVPDRYPNYPDHNRLASVYDAGPEGAKQIVTVLLPENDQNRKPLISRLGGENFTGCKIVQPSGALDLALESSGALIDLENITFSGEAMISRQLEEQAIFYFAKESLMYKIGKEGFTAEDPVTIFKRGSTGIVISEGTKLVLEGDGVSQLKFNPSVSV